MSARHLLTDYVRGPAFAWFLIVIVLCSQGDAKAQGSSPKVVVEAVVSDTDELRKVAESLSGGCGGGYRILEHPTTVGEFEGGNVKSIRVVRFANTPASLHVKSLQKDLQKELLKVWNGKFQDVYCYVAWDEGVFWYMEAEVEFEDGKRSLLVTDGSHVALQDHDGKGWYFRLLPAAQ
jgi:hypothetical protein